MRIVELYDDFVSLKKRGKGYFVITDIVGPAKLHHVHCHYVTERNFITKVIVNQNKNGEYYWVKNPNDLTADLHYCNRCMY